MISAKILFISLLSTILFGIVDGTFFLLAEESLQDKFMKISFFDSNMAELLSGGISASIAIFLTFYTHNIIHKYYHLVDHPLLDSIGVLIGTLLVIVAYYLYKRYKTEVLGEVMHLIHPRLKDNTVHKIDKHQFSTAN